MCRFKMEKRHINAINKFKDLTPDEELAIIDEVVYWCNWGVGDPQKTKANQDAVYDLFDIGVFDLDVEWSTEDYHKLKLSWRDVQDLGFEEYFK